MNVKAWQGWGKEAPLEAEVTGYDPKTQTVTIEAKDVDESTRRIAAVENLSDAHVYLRRARSRRRVAR